MTSFSIPCWYQSVSCVISHRVTTVCTSRLFLNLWPPRFCLSAVNRWQSLGDEFYWYNHNRYRLFGYGIWYHVNLFSDRTSYKETYAYGTIMSVCWVLSIVNDAEIRRKRSVLCEMLKRTFKILILLVFCLKTFKNLKSGYSIKANAPEMYVRGHVLTCL